MSDHATTPARGRARASRRLRIALSLVLAACAGTIVSAPAPVGAAPATADDDVSGVTVVDIPYRSDVEVSPAEGWTIAECGSIAALPGIAVACEPSKLTFGAPEYDPDLPRQDVPVTLTTGTTSLAVVYRVGLAPPAPPALESTTAPAPSAQGSRVLVPLSDLHVTCTLCSAEGGTRIEALGISPRRAGTVGVTSTHLVLASAPDFAGDAEVRVRVVDDLGQASEPATITVPLYPPGPSTLLALHTVVEAERDGTTAVDLTSLAASSDPDERPVIAGCGAAVLGTAVCPGDGSAEFRSSGAPVDQFSFTVVTEDGERATGSVTIVAPGLADAPLPGLAPSEGHRESRTVVPSRVPIEDPPAPDPSPFDALIGLLDRTTR